MAEVDIAPRFGVELKDGFKPVNAWVSNGITWLEDIQQFYRERSTIEKEYSSKLSALAKKYYEKKSKKSSSLSVGETPSLTPGSLESASLTTWTTQLTTLEARAAEHDRFGTELIVHVAEPLKQVANRFEELRKSHAEYAAKLEKERDSAYVDLKKVKGKYDGACQDVEHKRKKVEGAFDYGRGKAQSSYQQQMMEMRNAKNTYLININVTNKLKERYYHEYVPDLLDSLQDLSETRVAKVNSIWSLAAEIETGTLTRSMEQVKHLSSEIPRNNPLLDSMMFVRHNVTAWNEPLDMVFEPSPVWLDDAGMAIDEPSKIFLRNILGRSKGQLRELKSETDKKGKEVQGAKMVRANVRAGKDKRDELELVRAIFSLQGDLHEAERKRLTAEVEVSTITSVVGDLSLGAKNHSFKSQTFKIPTNCDLCGDRIWGLSAKGFDCRDCGYTCHSKCELRVPAECPGEQSKEDKRKLKIERQEAATAVSVESPTNGATAAVPSLTRHDTMTSLSSGYAATAQRSLSGRIVPTVASLDENSAPTPTPEPSAPAPKPAAKPIAGRKNRIVAPPPSAYVSGGPTSNGASGGDSGLKPGEKKGKMLYPYDANADGEISVGEGKDVVIMEEDDGSGWVRVRSGMSDGLVPAAYVKVGAASTPTPSDRPTSTYSDSSTSLTGSISNTHKKKGPAVAPKRGAKKVQYVEALYDYEARTDVEWSMTEGERFVLVNRDNGDGWADVEKGGLTKSVPANYIDEVS